MPSSHNPTGVTMNADRRERLVTLAQRARVPIVEDDPYGELPLPARPPLVAQSPNYVIYISSFSKTIAPSLRLGWITAPRTIFERLLLRKQSYDMATSLYVQAGVAEYLGRYYDAHLPKLRTELAARRAMARDAIATHWPKSMRLPKSDGSGYYIWATAPREMRARALLDASERAGASFLFGEAFFAASGGDHNFRLAITPVSHEGLVEGIRRIGAAIGSVAAR
jgi:2-aminoadipate transaminase